MRLYALALVLLVLLVYGQTMTFRFVNLDDPEYVTSNQAVLVGLTPASVLWAFDPTGYAANWHPLVWLSLMLDVELYGNWAGGFHVTNLLLHTFNSLLVFGLLNRLTGETARSFLVAALFAVHPLHVESVAWISERKDVLSTFFALWSLRFYARYATASSWRRCYLAAWLCLLLSLMSKQMYVTLPALFLVLDAWPLGRATPGLARSTTKTVELARTWGRLILEKVPFFALSIFFCGVAIWAQQLGGALNSMQPVPFGARLSNAVVSSAIYLRQTFWPVNLSVFYPLPPGGRSVAEVAACSVLLLGVTAWALRRPERLTGWLWYLISLAPVIGIIQVGEQAHADRYMYFPQIGLFIAVTWSIASALRRWSWAPRIAPPLAALVLLASTALAGSQTRHWKNSVALFTHAIAVTDANWLAHATLATALMETPDQIDVAQKHLRQALGIRPNNLTAHHNLGLLLTETGDLEQANQHFRQALQLNPDFVMSRVWLCVNLKQLGQTEELERERAQWEARQGFPPPELDPPTKHPR